jgi:hypothetical protein
MIDQDQMKSVLYGILTDKEPIPYTTEGFELLLKELHKQYPEDTYSILLEPLDLISSKDREQRISPRVSIILKQGETK